MRRIEVMSPLQKSKQKQGGAGPDEDSLSDVGPEIIETFESNIITAAKYVVGNRLDNILLVLQEGFIFILDIEKMDCIKMVDI